MSDESARHSQFDLIANRTTLEYRHGKRQGRNRIDENGAGW